MKSMRKLGAVAGTAIVVSLTLAACSGTGSTAPGTTPTGAASTAPASGEASDTHNAADTMFAQMMIVHHQGAIEMADLAVEKAESEEVRSLAEGISAAQGPEIERMTSWLEAWGEETSMGGMNMGMDMEGMSQEEVMAELAGLSGGDFDRRFLELMVAHHRGAVDMAQTQIESGQDPEAVALAEQIVADQEAEIAKMQDMLAAL